MTVAHDSCLLSCNILYCTFILGGGAVKRNVMLFFSLPFGYQLCILFLQFLFHWTYLPTFFLSPSRLDKWTKGPKISSVFQHVICYLFLLKSLFIEVRKLEMNVHLDVYVRVLKSRNKFSKINVSSFGRQVPYCMKMYNMSQAQFFFFFVPSLNLIPSK